MQALSVKQPWATLICTGLKDVENRTWQPSRLPGRFLIHASSSKVPSTWEDDPSEQVSNVKNARLLGQIPEYKDMPTGAIIGYVECNAIVRDADSPWAQPGCLHWCLTGARLFDTPIPGIKGAQGRLFDVPEVDEGNLPPSHEWICDFPDIQGDTLILPVSDAVARQLEQGADSIAFDMTGSFETLFFNQKTGKPATYKFIELVGKDKIFRKKFDGIDTSPYLLPGDKTVPVPEYNNPDILWSTCTVYFK